MLIGSMFTGCGGLDMAVQTVLGRTGKPHYSVTEDGQLRLLILVGMAKRVAS